MNPPNPQPVQYPEDGIPATRSREQAKELLAQKRGAGAETARGAGAEEKLALVTGQGW
jgi:hypothetical protein